jgi:hypothetical protein
LFVFRRRPALLPFNLPALCFHPQQQAAAAAGPSSSSATATRPPRPGAPAPPTRAAKQAALMARATGQAKSIGFLAFMMWMSGGGVHLFSLMMTASGLYQPVMAIAKSGEGEYEGRESGERRETKQCVHFFASAASHPMH